MGLRNAAFALGGRSRRGELPTLPAPRRSRTPAPVRRARNPRLPPAHRLVAAAGVLHPRSEEHTSELQSPCNLVCRLLLEKKKKRTLAHNKQIKRSIDNEV